MNKYYISGCKGQNDDIVTCKDSEAEFWTIYEHLRDGTSQGIIDLKFREDAEAALKVYTERDALQQKLNALAAPGIKWNTGSPSVPEESHERFWVVHRLKDGALNVTDLIFFNCPAPEDEDKFCDAEMTSPDGDPYWPEGWHDLCSHPDFDYFYNKSDLEVLAYAEFVKPEAPEIPADADKAGE